MQDRPPLRVAVVRFADDSVQVLGVVGCRLALREVCSAATATAGVRSLREVARAVLRQAAVRLASLQGLPRSGRLDPVHPPSTGVRCPG